MSNPFRTLLASKATPLGTWVKLPAVESVEIMMLAGLDFVVIDMEHSPLSMETVAAHLAMVRASDGVALVRAPDHSPVWISRALDAGAAAVSVPRVETAEAARDIAAATRLPPEGFRGFGPTSRAGGWGLRTHQYLESAAEVPVMIQIETAAGVAAVEEILDTGAVDAILIGPADLAVSLGRKLDSTEVRDACAEVLRACQRREIPCGIAIGADLPSAARLAEQGFAFVMMSNDASLLGAAAADLVRGFAGGTGGMEEHTK